DFSEREDFSLVSLLIRLASDSSRAFFEGEQPFLVLILIAFHIDFQFPLVHTTIFPKGRRGMKVGWLYLGFRFVASLKSDFLQRFEGWLLGPSILGRSVAGFHQEYALSVLLRILFFETSQHQVPRLALLVLCREFHAFCVCSFHDEVILT